MYIPQPTRKWIIRFPDMRRIEIAEGGYLVKQLVFSAYWITTWHKTSREARKKHKTLKEAAGHFTEVQIVKLGYKEQHVISDMWLGGI